MTKAQLIGATAKAISIRPVNLRLPTFQFTIDTQYSSAGTTYTINYLQFTGTIDWGDGTTSEVDLSDVDYTYHRYAAHGVYRISLFGDLGYIMLGRRTTTEYGNRSLLSVDMPFPRSMSQVTDASYLFTECDHLQKVPATLFRTLVNAETFFECFDGCISLEAIPPGLFSSCGSARSFAYTFNGCKKTKTIPAGLFDHCTEATNFYSCFSVNSALESVPFDLFSHCPDVTYFSSCFAFDRAITSAVPELWVSHPNAAHISCYWQCNNAANVSSIPPDWK